MKHRLVHSARDLLSRWPLDADDGWRGVDGPPWRMVESLAHATKTAGRELWRTRGFRRRGGPASPHPVAARLAQLQREHPGALELSAWRRRALPVALQAGAYTLAAELVDALAPTVGALPAATRGAILPPMISTWLAVGERERAIALTEAHREALAASAAGIGILHVLDRHTPRGAVDDPIRYDLPDGRLDGFGLDRALVRGELDHDCVRRVLLARPAALVVEPQLHLLAATAAANDRAAAAAALARVLRAYRLPRVAVGAASDNLLADLGAPELRPIDDGPLVSVLVTAYDAQATVGYAIDSLLAQTYRRLEILVADDGSRDGTAALLAARYGSDPRVRRFASTANQGPYNLRNALLAQARGDLVTFHDADDYALPTRIAAQVAALRRPGAAASFACFTRVTAAGRFVFFRDHAAVRLAMVSLMTTPDRLRALGGFRPAWFGADYDVYDRLRHRYGDAGVRVVRQPLIFGLCSSSSVTRRGGSESLEDGYRSPARRAYVELVLRQIMAGEFDDDEVVAMLRQHGNYAPPTGLVAG